MRILSDFSGVLVLGPEGFVQEVGKHLPGSKYEFENYFNSKECIGKMKQLFRGRVTEDEFWDDFVATIMFRFPEFCKENVEIMDNNWFKKLFRHATQINIPGTMDLYKRIIYHPLHVGRGGRVGRGIPEICVAADCAKEMIALSYNCHPEIFRFIQDEIWSPMIGQVKTDPCFFSLLLKGLRKEPDEYLFISKDREAIDLAKKSGIPSVLFVDAAQLEDEMSKLGFMFSPKEEA